MAGRKITIGQRFTRWTVLNYIGNSYWLCRCDCGTEARVFTGNLSAGYSKSCGCARREIPSPKRTHGRSKTTLYRKWHKMISRCYDRKRPEWRNYGGRGIRVCDRWRTFTNFLADMGECPPGRSLDRINNDGNYEPENCRWATQAEQANNKRSNRKITANGRTQNLAQWAKELGVSDPVIWTRLNRYGWSEERAVTQPKR